MTDSNSSPRKIAVIGGSGFVGNEVLRQLAAMPHKAVNIDRAPPREDHGAPWIEADLQDAVAVAKALQGCTDLIFLAAEWRDDVRPIARYYAVNVEGTKNVVAAARENGIANCVFTSTVSVYGPRQAGAPSTMPANRILR
jgi:nucleoside-diphosphate-sugar epimerase